MFLKPRSVQMFMSADIMSSLCGVVVHVNFSSKTTRPRDMLFFFSKKIPYLSRIKNGSSRANLSVRLFARAITMEVPPTKV